MFTTRSFSSKAHSLLSHRLRVIAKAVLTCCVALAFVSPALAQTQAKKNNKPGKGSDSKKENKKAEQTPPLEFEFDTTGNKAVIKSSKNKKGELTVTLEIHAKGQEKIRSTGSLVFTGNDVSIADSTITGFTSTSNEYCRVQGNSVSFLSMGLKSDMQRRPIQMRKAVLKLRGSNQPKLAVNIDTNKGKFSGKYVVTDNGIVPDTEAVKKRK